MHANKIEEEQNDLTLDKLYFYIDDINQSINSSERKFCIKSFLNELIPNLPLVLILLTKIEFKAVKIIDLEFPNAKLDTIITNAKLCQNSIHLINLLNNDGEKYNVIAHGVKDIERRYISLCCINYNSETNLDTTWKILEIIAPFLHIAITDMYQKEKQGLSKKKKLSPRETEILWWVSKGKTNYEIGMILDISAFTVKNHISNILCKLQVTNRAQALEKALSLGCFWT